VGVGDRLILRTSQRAAANAAPRQTDTVVTVRGIFTLGVAAVDERVVYLDLSQARKLFAVGDGVSVIELKVHDVWDVQSLAVRLGRATGLEPSNWLDRNTRLEAGLRAQASTGAMIKGFSLLTIAIGVASALYLSVSRRRAEIGILRSFGIGRGQIMRSFMLQGLTVGVCGAATGASLGYGFAVALLGYAANTVGAPSIPIDPARGEYVSAIVLASLASVVASLLPAWSASRIDPLEAIQS
jgi:lipoprotein-releasing system permease protein